MLSKHARSISPKHSPKHTPKDWKHTPKTPTPTSCGEYSHGYRNPLEVTLCINMLPAKVDLHRCGDALLETSCSAHGVCKRTPPWHTSAVADANHGQPRLCFARNSLRICNCAQKMIPTLACAIQCPDVLGTGSQVADPMICGATVSHACNQHLCSDVFASRSSGIAARVLLAAQSCM